MTPETSNQEWMALTVPLPVTAYGAQIIIGLLIFGALIALCAAALHNWAKVEEWLKKYLFNDQPWAKRAIWYAVLLSPVWLWLLVSTILGIVDLGFVPPESGEDMEVRFHYLTLIGLVTIFAGLAAAPFTLLRVQTVERQTTAQEQGLITDRINKAVEGLGAEKTVKRQRIRKTGKLAFESDENGELNFSKPIYEEITVPNIEVRIGSIYALERIAQDSLRDHVQIMEILCAYIRENAPASSAPELAETPKWIGGSDFLNQFWKREFFAWKKEVYKNIFPLKPRSDIQIVLNVIGRRSRRQKELEWGDWRPFGEIGSSEELYQMTDRLRTRNFLKSVFVEEKKPPFFILISVQLICVAQNSAG